MYADMLLTCGSKFHNYVCLRVCLDARMSNVCEAAYLILHMSYTMKALNPKPGDPKMGP